jgi:hypothetical protein
MSLLIGKTLKYKGDSDINAKKVIDVKGDQVIFSDNGRASIQTVNDKFEEVYVSNVSENIIPENNIQNNMNNSNDPMSPNYGGLVSQIESFVKTGNIPNNVEKRTGNVKTEEQIIGDMGNDYEQLTPETRQQVLRQIENNKKNIQAKKHAQENDPWLNQFNGGEISKPENNSEEINEEEVRRIDADEPKETRYQNKQGNNKNSNNSEKNSSLPKMKKTKSVKIKLELNEMIPKPEDIKAVQNLFEGVSIVEEIASEIADKYLSDRDLLEGMIIEQLENMMKPTKRRTTNKKTTTKTTTKTPTKPKKTKSNNETEKNL